MFPKVNPIKTQAWAKLESHLSSIKMDTIYQKCLLDEDRFAKFHIRWGDLLVDYSKNNITDETLQLLCELAKECRLDDAIKAMYGGERINVTEDRAVLHVALRSSRPGKFKINGVEVDKEVQSVLKQMEDLSDSVNKGLWKGSTGKSITDVVNIGIGGSDLGPVMVCEGLKAYRGRLNAFFVSNVDGSHIFEVLKDLDPETTMFLIASKTFTTQETMANAMSAKSWFASKLPNGDVSKHFVAISTNEEACMKFGIDKSSIFRFWDWVGGRFSLWSAIGLSISLYIGWDNYRKLLDGAEAMDEHFERTDFQNNIPVILALIGIWNVNFLGAESEAILPYDQYLHRFAAYFQQSNMESNGKKVDRNGEVVAYNTGPIIWGEPGTNGQHAFYQLIHQGTRFIPCDFLAGVEPVHPSLKDHHLLLLSNFFAQTEALMKGKTKEEVVNEFESKGVAAEEFNGLVPFKIFDGNRPTNSILYQKLSPFVLGALIAMYEHKIFAQGVIWNIYSFDQWGVELGKQLANVILPEINHTERITNHDPATRGIINAWKSMANDRDNIQS